MTFTESNTVERMILDAVSRPRQFPGVREARPGRWEYAPASELPRSLGDVMVEPWVREALIRLNPEIAAQPDRADEVIYNLRAILLSVQADGLVRANENFTAWLRGEKTLPFGSNGEHVPVRHRLTVTNQWTYQARPVEKRFDISPPTGSLSAW
jgi:type I restriction enzyme R subunit